MADIRLYANNADWSKQIDTLLKQGNDPEDIIKVFHDLVVDRDIARKRDLRRNEFKQALADLIEDYAVNRYGELSKRNYNADDFSTFALGVLDYVDKSMDELEMLESLGYQKIEDWSDAELAQEATMRTDGGAVGQRCTIRRETTVSRVAQNSPEKVLADFVKNL